MTNKEIFMMVFGKNPENLKRKASTIEWWDQEFIGQPDCDDVISRQVVKEQMIKYGFHAPDMTVTEFVENLPSVNPQENRDMEEIREVMSCDADAETKCKMISNILTTKPHYFEEQEPKTGHWTRELIRNEKGGCIGAKMICSECGNDNRHDEYMNYCPSCGAKMVEPQESEKIETWNGIHAQITAPKGTFERIFNDADDDNDI